MAKGTNVGKLTISIDGDTKGLEAAAKRTGRSLDGIKRDTRDTARRASAAFAGLAAAIAPAIAAVGGLTAALVAFQSTMSRITALDNLSQSTGIAIGQLDQLSAIAQQTGVAFDVLAQAAQDFGVRMSSELQSATSMGSQAIRALGISVKDADGNLRTFNDLLPEVAEKFSRLQDGSNKAALAAALFGEEVGPRLIPLLNRGGAALDEIRRKLGTTLTAEDARRARKYEEAVGELTRAFEELGTELTRLAAEPAGAFVRSLTEAVKAIERLPAAAQQAASAFSKQGIEGAKLQAVMDLLNKELARQAQLYMDQKIPLDRWDVAVDRILQKLIPLRDRVAGANRELQKLSIGPFETTVDLPDAPKLDDGTDRLAEAQFQLQQLTDRLLGTRDIFDDVNLSWTKHAEVVKQAMGAIDAAYEKSGDRRRAKAALDKQLNLAEQQAMLDTASLAAQTITKIWPQQKGAAIAAAVINTAVAVTKALTSAAPPWNFAQAALVAAAGAAQIAQIRSTNADGSGGGAAAVSSGSSAQPPAQPEQQQPGRALHIHGLDPAALFSGRQMEELIRAINNEVQNGARLISTSNLPI